MFLCIFSNQYRANFYNATIGVPGAVGFLLNLTNSHARTVSDKGHYVSVRKIKIKIE